MARILLIDDEEQVLCMLRLVLENAGYEVVIASDGEEGLKRFHSEPSDLVITDLVMPGKEGIETITELRKEQPQIKIIAISGGGRIPPDGYLATARQLGADRAFAKPVRKEVLLEAVRELLGGAAD